MPCRDTDMPCDDYGPSGHMTITKFEAMLCAFVTKLAVTDRLDKVVESIDWNEAGVTRREFESWWQAHLTKDTARRRREAALAKLTPDERRLLGL